MGRGESGARAGQPQPAASQPHPTPGHWCAVPRRPDPHLVDEDDAGLVRACNLKQEAHQLLALAAARGRRSASRGSGRQQLRASHQSGELLTGRLPCCRQTAPPKARPSSATHRYLDARVEAETVMKAVRQPSSGAAPAVATALASIVLPVPGGARGRKGRSRTAHLFQP